MDTKNNIRINLTGLSPKETAVFERVISFNITHGLKAETVPETSNADLIVTTADFFDLIDVEKENKTFIVISSDESTSLGDLQITPPLIITKVMGLITEAIKLAEIKHNTNTSSISSDIETNTEEESKPEDSIVSSTDHHNIEPQIEEPEPEQKKPHHALIIDDSAAIRKQLELELRDAGITSDYAECGEDAIEKTKETHFDLIFLDIIMPGIDGYETCKTIRSDTNYKKTPIIMLSGKTSPLDEVQGVIAGATTYLTKPVKSDKLQETLNRVTKWIENFAPSKRSS